jgi:uncharacterized protein with HEPN domain
MSERDLLLYVDDCIEAIEAIESYTCDIDFAGFVADRKTYSATLREFIVIGEAVSRIPEEIKNRHPDTAWRLIKDFRNFIVHEYFGIDAEIVWAAVTQELCGLKQEMTALREYLSSAVERGRP